MNSSRFQGFCRVDSGRFVDPSGAPLLLRGIGLGTFLLAEGYMFQFVDGPQSPRAIEAFIERAVGPSRAAEFWQRFRDTFITDEDIDQIARLGFDHVRLPINSRGVMSDDGTWIEEGLSRIDDIITWCRSAGLWVILDLHGAPGGQTGTNIDDSPNGRPELFESDLYRSRTVALWRMLAARYAQEPVVAGYDLLNEPLPYHWKDRFSDQLVSLYRDLTAAIREVDQNHTIIYEGTHWATCWDIFTAAWDPNSMLQFHKYWSPPDLPSVRRFMEVGRSLGLPIYLGESGENDPDWVFTAFSLCEDLGISWNFWTWKKVETHTSPYSVIAPDGWSDLTSMAAGGEPVSPDRAWSILEELIDAVRLDRCVPRPDIASALFRRVPLRVPAWGFGFRSEGESYGGISDAAPLTGFRENDAVTILPGEGVSTEDLGFLGDHGLRRSPETSLRVHLPAGGWLGYTLTAKEAGDYTVTPVLARGDARDVEIVGATGTTGTGQRISLTTGPCALRVVAHASVELLALEVCRAPR